MNIEIRKIAMIRLFDLDETPNEDGLHDLIPFDDTLAEFNEEFEEENLYEELDALVEHLYGGGGTYIEVNEDTVLETNGGFLRIQIDESLIEIPDILDKINTDPDISTIYLLVNQELTTGDWIVAEHIAS